MNMGRWNVVTKVATLLVLLVLSAILGPQIDFSFGMRGPGAFAVHWVNYFLGRLGLQPNLGLTLALIFGVDTAVCFAIFYRGDICC